MHEWRDVHARVRRLRRARATLDHAELALLCDVLRFQVWKQLSCATVLEYLERELGYGARAAHDRLRVAQELVALPKLDAAFAAGERSFSAVRELTRVATPETEGTWLAWSAKKSLRDIERGVVGHAKGALPDDPIDHENLVESLRFDVRGSTAALVRQARQVMRNERGSVPEDDEFVAGLARAFLDGDRDDKPAHQIAVTVCRSCEKGWQTGAGVEFPISAAEVERAKSDALVIGAIDGAVPQRAKHVVPPAVRRMVLARDGRRCQVPECTASACLEIAHINGIAESNKIDNRPENLLTICDGHHAAQHDGRLRIRGRAPDALEIERIEHPAPASVKAAARDALVRMGHGPRQAWEVVGRVVGVMNFAHVGTPTDAINDVITAALLAVGDRREW